MSRSRRLIESFFTEYQLENYADYSDVKEKLASECYIPFEINKQAEGLVWRAQLNKEETLELNDEVDKLREQGYIVRVDATTYYGEDDSENYSVVVALKNKAE